MKFTERIKWIILTSLQLHSKAPTKEIKRNWEIFAIGTTFIFFMNLLCGMPIFLSFKIEFPFSEVLNQYGSFIFWFFVIIFMIVFLKVDIKAKKCEKHDNTYILKTDV